MPNDTLTLGPFSALTYTLVLALSLTASAGIGLYRSRQRRKAGFIIDAYLGGLVGGVLVARLVHVLLNWHYFAYNLNEAFRISAGGLDWHGAVIGGLAGLTLVARWRRLPARDLIDSLTPALPLVALAGWFGCWSASCAYGAEVASLADYPAMMVWEGPDIFGIYAPRFNTQLLGILLSALILVAAVLSMLPERLAYRRFWLILALVSLAMFGIGFLRGDYALRAVGLRLDQWLDLATLAASLFLILRRRTS